MANAVHESYQSELTKIAVFLMGVMDMDSIGFHSWRDDIENRMREIEVERAIQSREEHSR